MSQPGNPMLQAQGASGTRGGSRLRAYLEFLAAILYFFLARSIAARGANGLVSDAWAPMVQQAMLLFLLVVGFAGFGFWLDRQVNPIAQQGLPRREGWLSEAGIGLATGWGITLACVLPLAVFGGIAISWNGQLTAWAWFFIDLIFFALVALAEEVAFRGYAFQRFERAVGATGATLGFAAIYAVLQLLNPGTNHAGLAVALLYSVLLSVAYLRTRALWVSWGINFAWKATRALLFGLSVSGVSSNSPVVQGDPMGPLWLNGGGYGLEDSWLAFFVMLAAVFVVLRVTRDLNFRYNAPVFVGAGMPVDLDAAARAQHDAAMGAAPPAPPPLVQIFPVAAPPPPVVLPPGSGNGSERS